MKNCILLYGTLFPSAKNAGPFRIATELRQHGYIVNCLDITVFGDQIKKLKIILKKIINNDTLWIGISTSFLTNIFNVLPLRDSSIKKSNQKLDSKLLKFMDFIRNCNPKIKFISGGSKVFPLEEYGFQIFKGYVDKEILDFTIACDKNNNAEDVFLPFINGTEFKNFTNSIIQYEESDIIDQNDFLPIEISRGCIFKCKFCSYPLNGKTKGEWIKKEDILLNELNRNYDLYGIRDYIFADDTYNDSVNKIKNLYDNVFSKLNFKINFTTYLRLDLMMRFPETVQYLKESGLKSGIIGIETLNAKSAKAIGKGVDPYEQLDFVRQLKQTDFKDIFITSGFILGLPFDSYDIGDELKEFLLSNKNYLDRWNVNTLTLSPRNLNNGKYYFSEFDLEYEKYGYTIHANDTQNRISWENLNTKINSKMCEIWANDINEVSRNSKKFKAGGFLYPYMKSINIPDEDLLTLSEKEIYIKYDIEKLRKEKKNQYIQKLKSFYMLENKS